ncbi:MAG TPA: ThuA domain-containing protein [Opitutaceae bacterium]|nr:ThuA domain-containing protein [Opitutaceae bacterium]
MNRLLSFLLTVCVVSSAALLHAAEPPLRIFIRSGPKSHGPGAHDYPRFLKEWVPLLNERGAKTTGGNAFPTEAQLAETDVLILHAQEAGNIPAVEDRRNLDTFLKRGGGLVVIHAGVVSSDPSWFKTIVGGSWRNGTTRWLEGPMHLYFIDRFGPITRDVSNWAMDDEIYYDLDLSPDAKVLATAYTPKPAASENPRAQQRANELTSGGKRVSIYDIQPQMWTYERTVEGGSKPYRAFVSIPGHYYENFNRPNYRAVLLRGIAWAGQRSNVDELCRPDELGDALRYVDGGPTHPSKAAAKIEVHPEFSLTLVASEPLINKVMNIDWDEKGRLWVCETPEYPNGRRAVSTAAWKDSGSLYPGQVQRDPEDSISILTDTDGDGVMDKRQVFADKLELVTSFVLYRNGVIAATAPDVWFLEDTNGDGVADRRTKLYTGLGIADTHAVLNNLRWGLDGWIYGTHGYSRGDIKSGDGQRTFGAISSGVVRFKPDGSAFEQYSSRGGNSWGLDTTWDGQVFWTQPTSGTVFFHTVLPESILAKGKVPGTTSSKGMIVGQKTFPAMTWPEQAYVQIDQVGRFTAAAGCVVYEGGAWPDKWNYSYFTGEPTLNIVHHQFVTPDGVSYTTAKEKGREETEFMRSTDLWFRPIETRVGPDGALYVVDFYNQAVIHNDTRGPVHGPANAAVRPDRDHYFSRIWRVQHKQAKTLPRPALERSDIGGLIRVIESHPNAHVKKTAWRLAQESSAGIAALARLQKPIGSQAEAQYTAARAATSSTDRQALLTTFVRASESWTQSAIIAAATENASAFLTEAFRATERNGLPVFITAVTPSLKSEEIAGVLEAAAAARSEGTRPLSLALLRSLSQASTLSPSASPALMTSLQRLLEDPATAAATLPLAARWDTAGTLASLQAQVAASLVKTLADGTQPEPTRAQAAVSLLSTTKTQSSALTQISALIAAQSTTPTLRTALIAAVGDVPGQAAANTLVAAFGQAHAQAAFEQIVKRPEFALALLAAVQSGQVKVADLGPGNVARLRTHPNPRVSQEAAKLLATLSPEIKEKDALIAKLAPEVEKPGNVANGKTLYTAACAVCHSHGDITGRDVGPPLTGMGAHGPAELLMHIIDPNREVDPSFYQWNITTQAGETFVGVIVSENAASLTLRNQGGDFEIKKDDIARRDNTRRSLMPEGFESMGAEGLRDLLTYICGSDQAFRVLDLRNAYTADSRRGMFKREDITDEGVNLSRFGNVSAGNVPFSVMDPAKSPNGRNVIALKGGVGTGSFSEEFPQRVEIPASVTAASLYFLGGVGGNAWPLGGDAAKGLPVLKVIVNFADGSREEHVLKNGVHFTDALDNAEVPGSTNAGNFTRRGQLRTFGLALSKKAALKSIVLESYDNDVVPCTVAITASAEPLKATASVSSSALSPSALSALIAAIPSTATWTEGPKEGWKGDAALPPLTPIQWEPGKTRVLLIGGGSSHNFTKFFGETDGATLRAAGFSVHYTEDRDQAAEALASADVAVISVNRRFFDAPAYRQALWQFAEAGKGIVMLHPGTWYGFSQWPELNAKIVGGGSRGHDKIAAFSVNATQPTHPIMKSVPASFTVEDELYYFNAEADKIPAGTAAITVLAETSPSQKYNRSHPAVWVTDHARARIVGITLGHDQRVHDHPALKQLLTNAIRWTAPQR